MNKKYILLFLLGLTIFLTPFFSNILFEIKNDSILENYYTYVDDKIKITVNKNNNEKETLSDYLYDEFEKYNKYIYEENQSNLFDPFSFETASFNLEQYGFEENIVGDIYIERLDVKLPIYIGATKKNMKKGATLLGCTSMPIGGINTNTVIAAHRGCGTKEMFRNIQKIDIGDIITITNFWGELKYKVIETRVIYPDEVENIVIQDNKELLTLSTCHPYRYNYQRYLVIAERFDN